MDINESIMDKIKRCLALSDSDNANEAAMALKHANALMQKHNLTMTDVKVSDVKEIKTRANFRGNNAPQWETNLVVIIASVFECVSIQSTGISNSWKFIGLHASADLAAYAYSVVIRHLINKRKEFIKKNKRLKRSTLIKRADAYCTGFVQGCRPAITAMNPEHAEIIKTFKDKKYGSIGISEPIDRLKDIDDRQKMALSAGYKDGRQVTIHTGVNADQSNQLEYAS